MKTARYSIFLTVLLGTMATKITLAQDDQGPTPTWRLGNGSSGGGQGIQLIMCGFMHEAGRLYQDHFEDLVARLTATDRRLAASPDSATPRPTLEAIDQALSEVSERLFILTPDTPEQSWGEQFVWSGERLSWRKDESQPWVHDVDGVYIGTLNDGTVVDQWYFVEERLRLLSFSGKLQLAAKELFRRAGFASLGDLSRDFMRWVEQDQAAMTIQRLTIRQASDMSFYVVEDEFISRDRLEPGKLYLVRPQGPNAGGYEFRIATKGHGLPGIAWLQAYLERQGHAPRELVRFGDVRLQPAPVDIFSTLPARFFHSYVNVPQDLMFVLHVHDRSGREITQPYLINYLGSSPDRREQFVDEVRSQVASIGDGPIFKTVWEPLNRNNDDMPAQILALTNITNSAEFGWRYVDNQWLVMPRRIRDPGSTTANIWGGSLFPNQVYLLFEPDHAHPQFGQWVPHLTVRASEDMVLFPLGAESIVSRRAFPSLATTDADYFQLIAPASDHHRAGQWQPLNQATPVLVHAFGGDNWELNPTTKAWETANATRSLAQLRRVPRPNQELVRLSNATANLERRFLARDWSINVSEIPNTDRLKAQLATLSDLDRKTANDLIAKIDLWRNALTANSQSASNVSQGTYGTSRTVRSVIEGRPVARSNRRRRTPSRPTAREQDAALEQANERYIRDSAVFGAIFGQ